MTVGTHLDGAVRDERACPLRDQALCRVDDECAVTFVRTNETRSRGVSDPRHGRARDRVRGVAEGVAHAPAATPLLTGLHRTRTRGKKRRANFPSATAFTHNNMRNVSLAHTASGLAPLTRLAKDPGGGPLLPTLSVPPPFAGSPNYAEPTRGERWA